MLHLYIFQTERKFFLLDSQVEHKTEMKQDLNEKNKNIVAIRCRKEPEENDYSRYTYKVRA